MNLQKFATVTTLKKGRESQFSLSLSPPWLRKLFYLPTNQKKSHAESALLGKYEEKTISQAGLLPSPFGCSSDPLKVYLLVFLFVFASIIHL